MIQLINIVIKVFFLKIEKKIFLDCFSHLQAFKAKKKEDSYQSSGLDVYFYALILNNVHLLI